MANNKLSISSTIGFSTGSDKTKAINNAINIPSGTTMSLSSNEKTMRKVIEDVPILSTPLDDCFCKTCRYRYPDPYGYRNGNCHKYKKESGKPNDILFKGAKCAYYRIDRSDKNKKEESK